MMGGKEWKDWFTLAVISYATNNRYGKDADGAGPGVMQVVMILRALHKEGIGCALGVLVDGVLV